MEPVAASASGDAEDQTTTAGVAARKEVDDKKNKADSTGGERNDIASDVNILKQSGGELQALQMRVGVEKNEGEKSAETAHGSNQVEAMSPTSTDDGKESSTQSRSSLRQRHRRESVPEKQAEQPFPAPPPVREKLPPVERPVNWFEGDLVWSLVSGHPLWPCIVTCDPESGVHSKMKGGGSLACRAYHVQFFGDSPEIAWINETRVYKFSGKDEYKDLVQKIAKKIPKRPPKVEISNRFIYNWNAGMDEISQAMPMTKDERIEKFTFRYVNGMPQKPGQEVEKKEILVEKKEKLVEKKKEKEPVAKKKKEKVHVEKTKDKEIAADRKREKEPARKISNDSTGSSKVNSTKAPYSQDKISSKEKDPTSPNGLRVKSNTSLLSVTETLDFVVKKYTASSTEAELADIVTSTASRILENKILTTKKSYACLYCQDIYFSVTDMRQHYKEKHPESEDIYSKTLNQSKQVQSPGPNTTEDVLCHICGERFANRRSLGQHRRFTHVFSESVQIADPMKPAAERFSSTPKDLVAIPVPLSRPKSESTPVTPRMRSRSLLSSQGKKDPICVVCEKNGDVITCTGDCYRSFHAECLGDHQVCDSFVCAECKTGGHRCIMCNKPGSNINGLGELKRCVVALCGRYFHSTCLQIYKLKGTSDMADKALGGGPNTRCPSHSCATCASKAMISATRGDESHKVKMPNRLFKCIRCPTAYHVGDDCLAAGSILLGGLSIVCPAHFKPVKTINHHHPVHISWCFVCSKGGELICCAACPAAFHAQCIDLDKTPEGDWHCLDCSCGIRPLYDDIVWVKLGTYRWWPGQVTHPNDIPDNIVRLQHGPGEFVVKFFGSNDYFWLSKCRVFLYQEGDNGATNRHCSRGISGVFKKALQEAEETFRDVTATRQLQEEVKNAENGKKPAPYKHIKCNKPVGNVQIYTAALSEVAKCTCRRADLHPCGAESECLNRMLMYECHPGVCPTGDRCENQRFQKCEYPPTEIFKTDWGGWGLKNKVFIKKGAFVNEYVGELVDEEECKRRIQRAHEKNITNFYMLTIDKDRIIDAGPKGNFSRFMNHCCGPNCETQKWMVNGDTRVGLFAVRDILPGEELTFNYNLDCLGNDKTKCECGSENCSGFIGVRPKAQMDGVKRERKKKRRYRRFDTLPQHDDFCFRCRQTGTLVCCDFKGCLRAFCLECLHLDKPPYGKWECPCHHCDWCGRRAQYFCSFCPNSFCGSHVKNQLQPSIPNKFDTCNDHDPHKAEFEMAEVVAMVNDSMNAPVDELEESTPSNGSPANVDSGQEDVNGASIGQKRKRKSVASSQAKRNRKTPDVA